MSNYEQIVEMESWFPHVPEAGYEYYTPEYGISQMPGATYQEPWSLWGELKNLAKPVLQTGVRLYETYLKGKGDAHALIYPYGMPQAPAVAEKELQDWQFFTPYTRKDSGTAPAPIRIGGVGGISPMLLIGGALVLFLMMKKGK